MTTGGREGKDVRFDARPTRRSRCRAARSCRPQRSSSGKSRARRRRTGRRRRSKPLADFWEARIARQKAIDASIAAKAEFEFLYDRPYSDPKTVRVAGPFTVESLSPHRTLGVDENDELIDPLQVKESGRSRRSSR